MSPIETQSHTLQKATRGTRILIVEDEKIIGCDIAKTLLALGYQVTGPFPDAEDALREIARFPPDLVLMDIVLAGPMNGIEAARLISEQHRVPVVFLSARADVSTIEEAKKAEPYGYILKPFHTAELRSTLEIALSRHQAELRSSKEGQKLAEAFRSMGDGVIATDLTGAITFLNPAAEKITGWSASEAIGHPLKEVFQITSNPNLRKAAGPKLPVLLKTRSGTLVPVEDSTAPIKDDLGSLRGLLVLLRIRPEIDASASPLSAPSEIPTPSALSPGSAHLSGLIESIGDPLIAIDAAGKLSFVNGQAASFLDQPREDLLGHPYGDAFPAAFRARCGEEFGRVLEEGESREFELHEEKTNRWLSVTAYPFDDGALALLRDITGRKRAAEREGRIEKLESLGLLARGFAHNFNNLLTVLLGNLSLAEMDTDDPIEIRHALANAKLATTEAQGLVQQLLVFAKGGAPIRRHVDLRSLLTEIFASLARRSTITYNLDLTDDLPAIEADPDQLRRLILNLVHNAEDAIIDDGYLTVRAGLEHLPKCADPTNPAEPRMLIEVIDTGEGMVEATRLRAFEPYFSTRDSANASGIGLTVCRSIVRSHGGEISIYSTPDGGTTVRAALPVGNPNEVPAHSDTPKKSHPLPPPTEKARILILEDEKMIRQLIVSNLRSQGFEVEATADGSETVTHYRKSLDAGRPFDLVIMDLSIPNGVGGATAMEQIRLMDPAVRAVVSSGYSDDPVMARHRDYGFSAVLPKPYRPIELTKLVNKLLGR